MESEETYQERKLKERVFNKKVNNTCKNTNADYEKYEFSGCVNLRRNGSAYCQECSDKHNK